MSLIAAGAALFGSLFGSAVGLWGTYAKFAQDNKAKLEANRSRAYTQLKGQQAELLVLLQQLAVAYDKGNFYQIRAAQQMVQGNDRRKPQARGIADQGSYLSDALQEERNTEHYADELVSCSESLFESIGLIQLSFSPDPALNKKIASAEAVLTRTDDLFPRETLRDRVLWAMTLQDAEQAISARQKQRIAYITKAVEPISDLLNYLQGRIQNDSR